MDTFKSLIVLLFILLFCSFANGQGLKLDSLSVSDCQSGRALLNYSKKIDDYSKIRSILEKCSNYTLRDKWGMTAFEVAYYWGHENSANAILDFIINQKDTTFLKESNVLPMIIVAGDTALMSKTLKRLPSRFLAQRNGEFLKCYEDFIDFYNFTNKYREADLIDSAFLYNTLDLDIAIGNLLINNGLDVNLSDSIGQNILFRHVDNYFIVNFLVSKCNNLNQIDINGKTFIQYRIEDWIKKIQYQFVNGNSFEAQKTNIIRQLDIIEYCVKKGAAVGKEKVCAWKYLLDQLPEKQFPEIVELVKIKYMHCLN